jgi:hypothetical protein
MPDEQDSQLRYAKFVARVWADEDLRQRLLSDPATVLKELELDVPAGKEVRIIEADLDKIAYVFLPTKPIDLPPDANLEQIALDIIPAERCDPCW